MVETLTLLTAYGPLGVFSVLFWKFITGTQKEQNETLTDLANAVDKLAKKVEE